ncbi:MAG: hypothetical protein LW817_03080, partial [Candidatus Caenarcaniphilales bacterium]|nr:hypothetical protein [Candidatus Caenarcaniphilales bacterium]
SIINEDQEPEKNQNAEKLAGREFKRTPPEKEKYQITTQTLRQLKDVQAGHENLEGGVKKNLKQTNKDLEENDDWISSWGGLTEQLRNQRDAEKNRLNGFDKQRRQIDELKTAADSLIKQGKYEDATELLKKTTDFASTAFQESNSNLIKDYKTINEELSKFDEKLKDASVTVAKNVAIGTVAVGVALALAPATGGLSLMAAGTMIGGGALAGFGVGLVTDLADAGVDMAVFDQTAGEAFKDFGTKQLQNARLSLTAASSATGTAGLSRILIARGFGAYGSAGLSASVSAPVTTTANFGIDRGLAELKYQNLSESQKAAYGSYDEFLKKESVDLNTLGRKLTVDTSIEVLGSLTGVKLESLFKAGKGAAKEINKEAVEALSKSITKDLAKHGLGTSSDIVYGLLAAQLTNPEGITSQDVAQNILQALTGRKIGEFTAKTFESRRNKNNPELQGVIESHKLKAGIDAQTRVRYDNQGNLLSADVEARPELIQKALNGDSIAQAKIKEESLVHALQKPIDPRITADGKVMPANHYKALRAQRELQSQAIADRLQAESETGSISKQRKNNNEAITKINQLIDAEQFDEAIKIAGNNGIDENYLDQYAEDYKHNIDPNRKYIEETNYSSNQTDTTTKNDTKSPPEIDQLINQIDDVDKLTDEQRQRLSSQLDALDTSTLSISEKADLAYLTGKLNGNPEQRLGYEVDLAISKKYRESDNDPKVVTDHVEALAPKIEAQIAELQKLQKDGADDKTLAEAFGKLERLGLEMSAIRASETVGLIAKDVQISSQVKDLDSYNTGRLAQGLRNPELQADARIKAEGFISDLALKPEDIKAREDAIGEIDSIALELYQGKLENSPEVSKQVQTIVDSINPDHLNQAKINQINSMVQEIKNNGTIGQLDQLTYDIYRGRTELTPEALNKIQSLADSIDKDSLSSQKAQQLQSIIVRKTQATINKLDEISYELKRGTAEYKPEIADKFQSLIDSMNPNDLSSENIQKINSLINEIKSSAKDSSKPIPNNLSVIRASNDLAPGIEAQTTVKYFKNGDITVDSSARPELIARARNGDSKALAILNEERAHGNEKPLEPLYKQDGSPRKDPLTKEAYTAIRAQRELAMQVKGKAQQAQADGTDVSSVKQGTKEALIKMTDAIKAGNYAEALAIAEKNGVGEIYIEQFGRDYDHNVNPKRTHLEETSFSADTIY